MIKVNAIGDACPVPVVKTKEAIKQINGAGDVEVLVDNEIAVQNLEKMAEQKGYKVDSRKLEENRYEVIFHIANTKSTASENKQNSKEAETTQSANIQSIDSQESCSEAIRKHKIVVISSAQMGTGNDELGSVLMKGFIYALAQQEELVDTILFYNSGASLTCEGSVSLEDLVALEAQGVEILTCGTCLNYYGLTEKLKVGTVTNMYVIAEKMTQADSIIRP